MTSVLLWYLTMQMFAFAATPLAFRVCTRLHDRGYGMAKGLGLILVTYITWLLGHTAFADHRGAAISFTSLSIALGVVLLVSGVSFLTHQAEFTRFVRLRWRALLAQEIVLLVAFAAMVTLRTFVPHISYHIGQTSSAGFMDFAAEKFTDFAVLNSLITAPSFPPHDAWLAGEHLNYYYFGHLLWACMIKFASVRPEVGFNLALGSTFALTCTLAFSLGYNLTRRLRWAALTMFLVALASNLDGFLQFLGIIKNSVLHQLGEGSWYYSPPWYRNYDFWRSSRAVENTITEFPAFSFVLGDLHAHVSSLVIVLTGWNLLVQIWRNARTEVSLFRYEWRNWDELILAALLAGAMSAANSWDAITFAVLLAAVLWASRTGARNPYAYEADWMPHARRLVDGLASAFLSALVSCLGVIGFFWLFISRFHSPLPKDKPIIAVPAYLRTHPLEFLTHWFIPGVPVLVLLLCLLIRVYLPRLREAPLELGDEARVPRQRFWALLAVAAAVACVLVPLWQAWVAILLFLATIVFFAALLTHRLVPGLRLIVALMFCFSLLAWFCEMFCFDDIFGEDIERINTVFKVYYGLWPVLAVGGVLSLRRLVRFAPAASRTARAWGLVVATVLLGGVYPVLAPLQRVAQSSVLGVAPPSVTRLGMAPAPMFSPEARATTVEEALDGMRYLKYMHPDDYHAMLWLRSNLEPAARLLESAGTQYSYHGRFGTMTGRPTYAGWVYHSYGWRGESFLPERTRRIDMARDIYQASSAREMLDLLKQEKIEYVIVGEREREDYVNLNEPALAEISDLIYRRGETSIYEINPDADPPDPAPLPPAPESPLKEEEPEPQPGLLDRMRISISDLLPPTTSPVEQEREVQDDTTSTELEDEVGTSPLEEIITWPASRLSENEATTVAEDMNAPTSMEVDTLTTSSGKSTGSLEIAE